MAMVGAADRKGCFAGLLSGHWFLPMFGFAGVTGVEENCFDKDTAKPELVDRGLTGDRKAKSSAFGTGWHRAVVDIEKIECSRMAGKRVGERVAAAHGRIA